MLVNVWLLLLVPKGVVAGIITLFVHRPGAGALKALDVTCMCIADNQTNVGGKACPWRDNS